MNYLGYGAPWGFGWDINGGKATPLIEDENNEDYNLKERAEVYAVMMHGWQQPYNQTPEYLVMHGTDFNYNNAHEYFKNLDKLINYLQSKP